VLPELEPVAVLADRLQADGDARGELLALELAAALARSSQESRSLCLAAHALRSRDPDLAWPPALAGCRGVIRAGLLVAGTWLPKRTPDLPTRVGPWCRDIVVLPSRAGLGLQALHDGVARSNLRLDGLWQKRSTVDAVTTLDLDSAQAIELPALGITQPVRNPDVLRQFHGLARLDAAHSPLTPEQLATLPSLALRSLAVGAMTRGQLRQLLDACPLLEELTLANSEHELEPHPAFDRLRALAVIDHRDDPPREHKLPDELSLARLESLFLSGATCRDIERLAELRLRRLTVHEPVGEARAIVNAVAKLGSLEHLGLIWHSSGSADIAPLSGLTRLRSLELGYRLTGELHAPATLERVAFRWSTVRIHGAVPSVHGISTTVYELQKQLDLASIKTLEVSATWSFVQNLEAPAGRLTSLETLLLDGAEVHPKWITWLEQLPRLRAVIWPNLSVRQQRAAAERLPHVQIIGADAPRLREAWPLPLELDPLAPSHWPKCE
jgi:hypothetical protein